MMPPILVSVLHPDGTETRYTYNVAGERTAAYHGNGTQTHYPRTASSVKKTPNRNTVRLKRPMCWTP